MTVRDEALAMLAYLPELAALTPALDGLGEEQCWRVIRRLAGHGAPDGQDFKGTRCIVWDGARNNYGYGKLNVRVGGAHTQFYVHVLAWRMTHGGRAVPANHDVDHRCDNPACFNPAHLAALLKWKNYRRAAVNTNRKRREAAAAGTEAMQW